MFGQRGEQFAYFGLEQADLTDDERNAILPERREVDADLGE